MPEQTVHEADELAGVPHPIDERRCLAPRARVVERAEDDVTGHRRRVRLHKAITELSSRCGALVGPQNAADWANSRNAETYGVAEATRNQGALAIARPTDLGSTEVAALFDDADLRRFETGVSQTGPGEQSAEPPAEHHYLNCVRERRSVDPLGVGVVDEASELADDLDILVVAVGPQPLVSFLPVLVAQFVGVEAESRRRHGSSSWWHQ